MKHPSNPQMSHTLSKGSLNKAAKPRGRAGAPGKQGARAMSRGLKKRKQGVNPFTSALGDLNG